MQGTCSIKCENGTIKDSSLICICGDGFSVVGDNFELKCVSDQEYLDKYFEIKNTKIINGLEFMIIA